VISIAVLRKGFNGREVYGTLHIVDLSGSDCAVLHRRGNRQNEFVRRENMSINKSLAALRQSLQLRSSRTHKGQHLNTHESTLAMLLSGPLDRAKIFVVACVGAEESNLDMTRQTISFAKEIKKVTAEDIDVSSPQDTALVSAAKSSNTAWAEELLRNKANVEDVDDVTGESVLVIATRTKNAPLVKMLLSFGAETETRDRNNDTALLIALRKGSKALAQELLKAGSNIYVNGKQGDTALILAVKNDFVDVARELMTAGANVDHADNDGNTPLMFAANNGNVEAVQMLLNAGADARARNSEGDYAIGFAVSNDDVATFRLLEPEMDSSYMTTKDPYGWTVLEYMRQSPKLKAFLAQRTKGAKKKK